MAAMAQLAIADPAAGSPEGLALRPSTIPDEFVAMFDGDSCSVSAEGYAGPQAPISCNCSRDRTAYPQAHSAFQVPRASLEDPYDQSRADLHPCSTYLHSYTQIRADSAGFPELDYSCNFSHSHSRNLDAGCGISITESLSVCEEQGESTEPCDGEDYSCSPVDSDKQNAPSEGLYVGSPHATTEIQEPLVQLSRASPHSFEEESSWLHEEHGDSTKPGGSLENYINLHAGYGDACDVGGPTHHQISRRGVASMHPADYGQDASGTSLFPDIQELDAHVTTCPSECSSVISVVTNTASESTSTNVDYAESHWTDAKHGSYLNYMETNFVKNLYSREYCALDVCGQGASKGSSSVSANLFEFKCWQSDDWCRRSMLKPPLPSCIPLALLKTPWIDHFRHHNYPYANHRINMENPSILSAMDEGEEVNSPAMEPNRGDYSRLPSFQSKMGHVEKLLCQNGSAGNDDGLRGSARDKRKHCDSNEAMGLLEQKGLQGFGHDRRKAMLLNMKKREFESGFEFEPSVKYKRGS